MSIFNLNDCIEGGSHEDGQIQKPEIMYGSSVSLVSSYYILLQFCEAHLQGQPS